MVLDYVMILFGRYISIPNKNDKKRNKTINSLQAH